MKIFNPQKDQEVIGRKCKACQKTFYGKNSTNLKAHLEKFHPDISKVITSKSVLVLFPVSNISKSSPDQISAQKVIESTQGVSSSSSSLTDAANVLITPPRALSSTLVSNDSVNVSSKNFKLYY